MRAPTRLHIAPLLAVVLAGTLVASATASTTSTRFVLSVPVLFYHHVLCAPPDTTFPDLYICPEQLEAQLTYLRDQGWHTLTGDDVADLLAARQCPDPKSFVVSFDDGAADQYDNAAPILESLDMRGTFFVTTGKEGGLRPGKITWDGLRDLVARGHAIGDHSKTHENEKKLDAAGLYDQIEVAQQMFEAQLGFRPRTFAYPYGRYNDLVIAQVASSGLELAFTVHAGAREASDLPFLSKRIAVFQTDSPADVLARLQPFVDGCRPPTPDLGIATSKAGPWKGEDIHSSTAWSSQTLKRTGVKVGQAYQFWVRIENEAQRAGTFKVATSTAGTAGMTVRYLVNGVDVTMSVNAGTYATTSMDPWSTRLLLVSVMPTHRVAGASTTVTVSATSPSDVTRVDVVRLVAAF